MSDHEHVGWESAFSVIRSDPAYSPDAMIAAPAGWPRCGAATRLSASEFAKLTALPHPADPVLHDLGCELGSGHEGSHVAFTVSAHGGEHWWWLRWAGWLRQVVQISPCDHRQRIGPHLDDCLLPRRHPGPHSFNIHVWAGAG